MSVVELGNRDLNWGKVVPPAWYRINIKSIGEKPSKDGNSVNYPTEGEILFDGETGSTEYAGVSVIWNFNSKAMGGFVALMRALGEEPKAGQRINTEAAVGCTVDVFVENDTYDGRLVHRVNHKYRAPKPEVNAVNS